MKRPLMSKRGSKRKKVSHLDLEHESLLLEDVIKFLVSGDPKSPGITQKLMFLESVSHSVGLTPDNITALIGIISREKFKVRVLKRLILCLIPNTVVAEEASLMAVYCITYPSFPLDLKIHLIKWLCAVANYLETLQTISSLYSALFTLVESDLLRPYVCELLYKLTTAEHVTPYRIKHLIDIQSRVGSHSFLLALLQLYTSYRPDLVIVHCSYKKCFLSLGRLPLYIAQVKRTISGKTSASEEAEQLMVKKEITAFTHLSEIIHSLKGNVGIVKLLQSPIRRVLLTSKLPETFMVRLSLFLRVTLFTETAWKSSFLHECPRDSVLPVLSRIIKELSEGVPDVLKFVAAYFKIWDGQVSFGLVLDLLQYWEICPFYDILETILNPLYKQFCFSPLHFQCHVIHCLTDMYKNWVLYEGPRFLGRAENLATSPTSQKQMTIFEREIVLFDPDEQVQAMAAYMDQLFILSLHIHPDHPPELLYEILRFYETALMVHEYCTSSPLCVPPPLIVCAWCFSPNAAILSRACGLFCRYREEVYRMRKTGVVSSPVPVTELNSYISDLCNMLGLHAAFRRKEKSIFFQMKLSPAAEKAFMSIDESFSIYRHPALFAVAVKFLVGEREELSLHSLLEVPTIREAYFRHMSSFGFRDIVRFLKTFTRSLSLMPYEQESNRDVL